MQISVNTKITGVEKLVFFTSQTPQVKGVIAIHNTLRGPALGGCRIYHYDTIIKSNAVFIPIYIDIMYSSGFSDIHRVS